MYIARDVASILRECELHRDIMRYIFLLTISAALFLTSLDVSAQLGQGFVPEEDGVTPGSIIARDPQTGSFHLSRTVSSPNVFGVIVESPIMTLRPDDEDGVSALRNGQAEVNVIYTGEDIETGDSITTSQVPGYGMRATPEHQYIVGVALESFTADDAGEALETDAGEVIQTGTLLIDIQIGAREQDATPPPAGEEGVTPLGAQFEHYIVVAVRYLVAALVALGSLYLSYRFFKANVTGGLAALGRNPLARQSIQKMMLLNMFLVILITTGGLALSAFILILPSILPV